MNLKSFRGHVNRSLRVACRLFGCKFMSGISNPIYLDGAPAGVWRFEFEIRVPEPRGRPKETLKRK